MGPFETLGRGKDSSKFASVPVPASIPEGTSPFIAESIRRTRLEREQTRVLEAALADQGMDLERLRLERWWRKRLDYSSASRSRRRARMRDAEFESFTRAEILRRDGRICYLCGKSGLKDSEIHIDHVVPIARGGGHTKENVAVACAGCNIRKGSMMLSEYRASLRE